jgi:hypothetical protein
MFRGLEMNVGGNIAILPQDTAPTSVAELTGAINA